MAVGDVTGDGYPDAVLALPYDSYDEDDAPAPRGAIAILRGSSRGLRQKPVLIRQESDGVPGRSSAGDEFGSTLVVGKIDSDRYADIVVGAPGERRAAGRITVIRGGSAGYARGGHRVLEPGVAGVPPAARGRFGEAMTLLDHDGDGLPDLSVAFPAARNRGVILVMRGSPTGLDVAGAQSVTLDRLGLEARGRRLQPQFGRADGSCCEPGGGVY